MREIEIEFGCGNTVKECHQELVDRAEKSKCLIKGSFNGKLLTSSMSLNDCYVAVTGITEDEYNNKKLQEIEERKRFRESIPSITKEYLEKAKGIIEDDKIELWEFIVNKSLNGIYQGLELDATLNLIKALKNSSFEETAELLDSQGHSGMSMMLVLSLVGQLDKRGEEFRRYVSERL